MSAYGLTEGLTSNGVTLSTNWGSNTGTVTTVITSDDDNASYARTSNTNYPLRSSLTDSTSTGVINSVTVQVKARAGYQDSATGQVGMYVAGHGYLWDTINTVLANSGSYDLLTFQSTTRPGGGAWTWADVDNLEVAVQATALGSGDQIRVSYVSATVDYATATPNTVTFATPAHPAAAFVTPSQSNVLVGRFSMQRTAGTTPSGVINTVTIRNSGTTPYLTVSGVDIWRDVNANGTLETGTDLKLNASPATFSGTDAVVTIDEPISDSAVGYLVAYNVTGTAMDGNTMSASVQAATATNVGTLSGLPRTTGSVFTVDNANPTAAVTSPTASQVVAGTSGSSRTLSGTAADSVSGITAAHVRIQRSSDSLYWTGSTWGAETWLSASLSAPNWTYDLTLPTNNRADTYMLVARATDGVSRTGLSSSVSFLVDSVGPAITGATATSNTQVEVTFGEDVTASSIQASDFVITGDAGLTVSSVDVSDARTVVLTTTSQVAATAYTVTIAGDATMFVTDAYGNKNTANTSAGFTGVSVPTLTAAPGPDRPASRVYVKPSTTGVVVDEIRFSAPTDAVTMAQMTVVGLDTGNQLQTDVAGVRLYVDNGDGVFSTGTDAQLGSTLTFDSQTGGTGKAVFSGLSLDVSAGGSRDVWIVYDVNSSAVNGRGIGSRVQSSGVTVTPPATVTPFATINSSSSGQTIVVDAVVPTAGVTQPVDGAALALTAGTVYSIHGTASDALSGVSNVQVRVSKNGGLYWDGAAWSLSETWLQATDTSGDGSWSTWDPDFPIPTSDGTDTFAVTVQVTDTAGNTTVSASSFTVDNVSPYIQSAFAIDSTHVDVVFNEDLDSLTVAPTDFTVTGLSVSAISWPDGRTVRLTTSAQIPDTVYTITVNAGDVADIIGNTNDATSYPFAAFGSTGDMTPPSIPGSTTATAGTISPLIATVAWAASSDDIAVTGYNVWRAVNPAGPFTKIATVAGTTYPDEYGVPGQSYFYRVSAFDAAGNESAQSTIAGPVSATWSVEPHETYTRSTDLCRLCHSVHEAATTAALFRQTGGEPGELSVCYACHDGSGASTNIESAAANSFAVELSSGHSVEATTTSPDLTNICSDCHSPHSDVQASPTLPGKTVNGTAVAASGNSWCLACHDDAASWYGAGYGSLITSPTVDAAGYPVAGTFPGATTYLDATVNAHLGIPASSSPTTRTAGDCLYCHVSHRAAAPYDGLVATFTVSTAAPKDTTDGEFAALCFECHDGSLAGAENIKQYVTGGTERSGHKIKTAGGLYPVGAPLPCFECHNPHGSTRGNARLLSDVLGGSLDPTSTAPAQVRQFCFTCHTTSDTAKGWDSEANAGAGAFTTAIAAGDTVAGLSRDAAPGTNLLRLPSVVGHMEGDLQDCYQCHGSSYASGGNNVHSPSGGVSTGGTSCYGCHSAYEAPMDRTGVDRELSYHHVMGTASTAGDQAPNEGIYPTEPQDVYCVSCHSDHNYFNASQAGNLRSSALDASGATVAASDYLAGAAPYGVCVSCHQVSLTKEVTGLQKDDGSTSTPKIVGGNASGGYSLSAHSYEATSAFGDATTFSANCVKCHDDEQTKEFQTSTNTFGTHWSATRRLLSALGGGQTDPLQEQFCYRCHSTVYNPNAGSAKDYYGTGAMTTAGTTSVYEQFQLGGSAHPVAAGNVECESCHNAHVVSSLSKVTDPLNTYNTMAYANVDSQPAYCLRCHDADGGPSRVVDGTTYVPYDVTMASATSDKATNAARGHWTANGSISAAERVSCAVCHDNHGSSAPKLLGAYDAATGSNKIVGTAKTVTVNANDNTVCDACHQNASAAWSTGYVRDSAGYPVDGTWPGMGVYTDTTDLGASTVGIHVALTGGGHAEGSCNNCHNVHGTENPYDEIVGTFTDSNFSSCFRCHDGSVAWDIKQFYPTTAGGAATQSGTLPTGTRFGHRVRSNVAGATLSQDEAVPCYDCHNPHGSGSLDGLMVVTKTTSTNTVVIGDDTGEIDMSSNAGNRRFCFTCHTTSDNNYGWNGTAMAQVTSGATFEGIDRVNTSYRLRLPNTNGHRLADSQSCYQCHGSNYGTGGSNVHNPTGGVSAGGQDCYGCHSAYIVMEDNTGSQLGGAARLNSFHHVLGGTIGATYYDGDEADQFWVGQYPPGGTNVYCLSCHVDHDKFNANKGANLRDSMAANPTAANTDYSSSNGGVCLGCHAASRTKDSANQKPGGSTSTIAIDNAKYAASKHQYPVNSAYGASTFQANCVKCHDDEQPVEYQSSTYTFGTHWSAENRVLAALGVTVPASAQTEEAMCYKCHSGAGPNDGYNAAVAPMTAAARSLQTIFSKTYKHNVASYSGQHVANETTMATKHIECEDCHGVHASQSGLHAAKNATTGSIAGGATYGAWGVKPNTWPATAWGVPSSTQTNWTVKTMAGGSDDLEGYICLKCHSNYTAMLSGQTPPSGLHSTANTFTNLAQEFNPNNASAHAVFGASKADSRAYGSYINGWTYNSRMTCSDCHTQEGTGASGPHGSANRWILKWAYDPATDGRSGGTSFCLQCHNPGANSGGTTTGGSGFRGKGGNGHADSEHSTYPCSQCHITPPHGWQQPHMLNDSTHVANPYTYYINNVGGNDYVVVTWRDYYAWTESSCQHSPCN
jgi:hypothetical protein